MLNLIESELIFYADEGVTRLKRISERDEACVLHKTRVDSARSSVPLKFAL